MIHKMSSAMFNLVAAFLRITVVFIVLVVVTDASTRMWYMYAPLDHWLTFSSVRVYQDEGGDARIEYVRQPQGQQVATYHRSLLTFYPSDRLTCTKSSLAIIEPSLPETLSFPLENVLADNCADLLKGEAVEGRMRIAYIFDFPFGVKRMTIRYSNNFRLQYVNGKPVVRPVVNLAAARY